MAVWPALLPQCPLREGYQATEGWGVIQAPVEGPQLTRLRYTATPRPRLASFYLDTNALRAEWETFYYTTIAQGALPFDAAFEGTEAVHEYRIVGAPEVAPMGVGWRLTMQLVRLP
ncbi:hypothetical protein [uncultured Brevundimonas sp.]|uniref:hypothetical protein n=1 Tax=uncultured Brevundimonas sp. TaxID=213418 RepID=UPI0030EC093E|tara:strand:+ start:22472 stop:22819 length:348 start_codon:yes stop_codon:yes gene_type:complete